MSPFVYTSQSLETLRQKIDLYEVLADFLSLKKTGGTWKALCPFHEEKTPSFMLRAGDRHYHCFGCHAHGDAITFLMQYQHLSFVEACEWLANRFHVVLEQEAGQGEREAGVSKAELRRILEKSTELFHAALLETDAGKIALQYLAGRSIDKRFIQKYRIGFAPFDTLTCLQKAGFSERTFAEAGLVAQNGKLLFQGRITFPIRDGMGQVIGFSARKIDEEHLGPKYINTPETTLFKKSRVLYGLFESRKQILSGKKVLVVEGQVDALQMIDAGFDWTVAGQGTAFGEGHVVELKHLGVKEAILLFDGDSAGKEAALKTGDLFQREGIAVRVAMLAEGSDPDSCLRREGKEGMAKVLGSAQGFLNFAVDYAKGRADLRTPEGKNAVLQEWRMRMKEWKSPLMVYENTKRLAALLDIPERFVAIKNKGEEMPRAETSLHPDALLEVEVLRFLIVVAESIPDIRPFCLTHLVESHFTQPHYRRIFAVYSTHFVDKAPADRLALIAKLTHEEDQEWVAALTAQPLTPQKAIEGAREVVQRMLDRTWLKARDAICQTLNAGLLTEEEKLEKIRTFDALKRPLAQFIADPKPSPHQKGKKPLEEELNDYF